MEWILKNASLEDVPAKRAYDLVALVVYEGREITIGKTKTQDLNDIMIGVSERGEIIDSIPIGLLKNISEDIGQIVYSEGDREFILKNKSDTVIHVKRYNQESFSLNKGDKIALRYGDSLFFGDREYEGDRGYGPIIYHEEREVAEVREEGE